MAAGPGVVRAVAGLFACVVVLSGCGSSAAAGPSLSTGDPAHYLVKLSDLPSPDFTVDQAAHAADAAELAHENATRAVRLTQDGLQAGAAVRYFRAVDLATANGPIDVVNTVERFATAAGAGTAYATDVQDLDAAVGAAPISTGGLGDEAHAVSLVRTASSGVQAVQITLEWRVANVVNILVLRGRYGGARLDDALVLAHRTTTRELAGS
jgi:hypothetical protein